MEDEIQDSFSRSNGETFVLRGDEYVFFSDFTLKFIAEVTNGADSKEGSWLCACESKPHQQLESRNLILPASCFDLGKAKFLKILREKFSGGTFSLSPDSQKADVVNLYHFLKQEYQSGERQKCLMTKHVGFQGDGYWYISKELHFKNGKALTEKEHEYFCESPELKSMCTVIGKHLISPSHNFEETMHRFFLLCKKAFGINEEPFLAAAAFVIWRIICNADNEGWTGKATASIGIIQGQDKSIGKTTALQILAYGQGIPHREHPLLVSLGDQRLSGTSIKKIGKTVASSTLVAFLDDGEMSPQLSEFLLQLQGGFIQGSLTRGSIIPKGSVLLTSNHSEQLRLSGRVIKFPFKKGSSFNRELEENVQELYSFVEKNKGLLALWAIKYDSLVQEAHRKFLLDLTELLHHIFPNEQARWIKGVAGVIITQALLCISTKQSDDHLHSIFKQHISFSMKKNPAPLDVLHKVQLAVLKQIQGDQSVSKVLKWLNPAVKLNTSDEGKGSHAIGIRQTMINKWQDLSPQEVKKLVQSYGYSAVNISMAFGHGEHVCLQDFRKRAKDKVHMKKGVKIPVKHLNKKLAELIDTITKATEDIFPSETEDLLASIRREITEDALSPTPELEEGVLSQLAVIETGLQKLLQDQQTSENDVLSGEERIGEDVETSENPPTLVAAADCTPWRGAPDEAPARRTLLPDTTIQSIFPEVSADVTCPVEGEGMDLTNLLPSPEVDNVNYTAWCPPRGWPDYSSSNPSNGLATPEPPLQMYIGIQRRVVPVKQQPLAGEKNQEWKMEMEIAEKEASSSRRW